MNQLYNYNTLIDNGKDASLPTYFKQSKVYLIFDIKYDGRHQERCVTDRDLAYIYVDSVNYGVVPLQGLWIVVFLTELNKIDIWATDIWNVYLETETSKKMVIVVGPESCERQGCIIAVFKVMYGLCSSGRQCYNTFADDLCNMD